MLIDSWSIYESYISPLGISWMVTPGSHYGPGVDGYEYSLWGTYHKADHIIIRVDRTIEKGTGFTGQYFEENKCLYENPSSTPKCLFYSSITSLTQTILIAAKP